MSPLHHPRAAELPAPQQHHAEARIVACRGHQPAAARQDRRRIGEAPGRHVDRIEALRRDQIVGGEASEVLGCDAESRAGHAERIEQPLLHEHVETLARDLLDHRAHDVEADRIMPGRAGLGHQRKLRDALDHVGEAVRLRPDARLTQPGAVQRRRDAARVIGVPEHAVVGDAVAEPRRVRQQVAHRHDVARRCAVEAGLVVRCHFQTAKRGEHVGNRLVEPELAVLDQHHRAGGGDRLAHRIDAPQRVLVGLHRAGQRQGARIDVADRRAVEGQGGGRARDLFLGHPAVEEHLDGWPGF